MEKEQTYTTGIEDKDEAMVAALNQELHQASIFTADTINAIQIIRKQMNAQETTLYWVEVKMSNYRDTFSEADRSLIGSLMLVIDGLNVILNNLLCQAEGVQVHIKKVIHELKEVKKGDEERMKVVCEEMHAISRRISALRKLYDIYGRGQGLFTKSVNEVGALLKDRIPQKKDTFLEKITKVTLKRR